MEGLGFIHEKLDIKILILFILGRLNQKVDTDTLTELCLCDGGISYFDYTECLSELIDTGHVAFENELYEITEKGRKNGKITESSIPYSVRVKAEKEIAIKIQLFRRNSMIKADATECEDGSYTITLSMSDGLGDILQIKLLAGDKTQAKALCTGFKNRSVEIYGALINEILGK